MNQINTFLSIKEEGREVELPGKSDMFGLLVNKEVCFTTHKNKFHQGLMKTQSRILKNFASLLTRFLEPDEEILLAVKACSPMTFMEQYTTGWIIYYLKRCVLIFTNKRILHIPATYKYVPKKSISQISYGDIASFSLPSFFGYFMKLTYRNCKKETFYYVSPREHRKLREILQSRINISQPSDFKERIHLCPSCTKPLQKDLFVCQSCYLEFKTPQEAVKRSIIFPGGGYFYTNHPWLGVADAVAEVSLFLAVLLSLINAITGTKEDWSAVFAFGIFLGLEKLVTILHAQHFIAEYLPVNEEFLPNKNF